MKKNQILILTFLLFLIILIIVIFKENKDLGLKMELNITDAAAYLELKKGTLYTWISKKINHLPYYKRGKKLIFKQDELDAWQNARTIKGGTSTK